MDEKGRRIRKTEPMKKPAAAEKKQEIYPAQKVLKRPATKTPEPALKKQKSFYGDGDATKAGRRTKEKTEAWPDDQQKADEEDGSQEGSEDEEAESIEESDSKEGDEEEELEEEDGLGRREESEFGSDATTLILGGEENERIVAPEDDPANCVTMESAWEDGEKRILKLT